MLRSTPWLLLAALAAFLVPAASAQDGGVVAQAEAAGATPAEAASLARAVAGVLLPEERAKLTASDPADTDVFGAFVAISGGTAVVGAIYDDDAGDFSGSAYVFVRSGTTWTQQAKLTASDAAGGDTFGSVAIDGETIVVGARSKDSAAGADVGAAYVFVRSGTTWTEQAKLMASDGAANDQFGYFVSLSGETAVVGVHQDDNAQGIDAGAAYVFVRSGTAWTEQAKLVASDGAANDRFGYAVSLSGETAVVGAYLDDSVPGADVGAAYVFVRSGTTWTEQAKLTASDGAYLDQFGVDVDISGETVIVGAFTDDNAGGINAGSAYVFVRSGTTWTEQAKLTASDGAASDWFGSEVAISGETAVVAAHRDDNARGADAGSAYVFVRSGATWTEQAKLTASDGGPYDWFGDSVALSDDTILIGASQDDDGGTNAGAVYLFAPPPPVASVTLDGAAGWRMLASPEPTTVGAFLGALWTQGFAGADDPAGACSVFTFDEAAASFPDGWTCVADATDDLLRGEGLMVYVFEDDDNDGTVTAAEAFPKTLASSSAIAPTGDFAFSVAFTDDGRPLAQTGWNLLGAPFGTSLDWDAVTGAGMTPTVYVYDPSFEGGAYRTYTSMNGLGNGDLPGGLVPPFQGFFAKAYAPSPSLVLPLVGGTADGRDVYGRLAPSDPPLPPAAPRQTVSAATASGDGPVLATALGAVSPNPTASGATVAWTLAEAGPVRLTVVDLLGREVTVLASGPFAAGPQRSAVPAGLAPGVYVVRLQAGAVAEAARFTVTR